MDNRFYKIKENIKVKKQALRSICAGLALFAVLFIITKIFGISVCPIKNIFNISCFGCGMTRAFICILKFDFADALKLNVLSIPLFAGITIYVILLLTDILSGKNYLEIAEKFLSKKYMYPVYITVLCIGYYFNNL